ncbi:hypothetical protein D3272_06225 [Lichenibacterium ramalinae]|uniref:Uncharacterized protein n=1 Tax=Lichenibacterium ramalinae TaxID=2316527 RepID=A0A4Q2RF76_9HYPH|nr:hypothetical protein D3272_06225 [Lichenibacterium ramalinae]
MKRPVTVWDDVDVTPPGLVTASVEEVERDGGDMRADLDWRDPRGDLGRSHGHTARAVGSTKA